MKKKIPEKNTHGKTSSLIINKPDSVKKPLLQEGKNTTTSDQNPSKPPVRKGLIAFFESKSPHMHSKLLDGDIDKLFLDDDANPKVMAKIKQKHCDWYWKNGALVYQKMYAGMKTTFKIIIHNPVFVYICIIINAIAHAMMGNAAIEKNAQHSSTTGTDAFLSAFEQHVLASENTVPFPHDLPTWLLYLINNIAVTISSTIFNLFGFLKHQNRERNDAFEQVKEELPQLPATATICAL